MAKVSIREKIITGDRVSLYLDIYHGNGRREYRFLKIYAPQKRRGMSKEEKEIYESKHALARQIANKVENEILGGEYGINQRKRELVDIIETLEVLAKKSDTKGNQYKAAAKAFAKYIKKETGRSAVRSSEITETIFYGFAKFLRENYQGNTPRHYFLKVRSLFNRLTERGVYTRNPAGKVTAPRGEDALLKSILTQDEIQKLANTKCPNSELKRGFLFACTTGVGYKDLSNLSWDNIVDGKYLDYSRGKTKIRVRVPLNDVALKLLGKRGGGKLFDLPSYHTARHELTKWSRDAAVNKNITTYSPRHSFAVAVLRGGGNIHTLSKLLGHTKITTTQRYLQLVPGDLESAVDNIKF